MKKDFINPIVKVGLHFITRMRPDSNSYYLYTRPPRLGRDTALCAASVLKYYRLCFQMEFHIRDEKQPAGFDDCQARSANKLDFHFNMS